MNQPLLHLDTVASCAAADGLDALAAAELRHRHHNLLAVVQALANQTLLKAASLSEAHARLSARLDHLARSHELLEPGHWDECDIARVLSRTLHDDLGVDPAMLLSSGPCQALEPEQARWLSMAFYELATNALKYGALSQPNGIVVIRWWAHDPVSGAIRFEWRERGGPPIALPVREGFGTGLIRRSLAAALGGPVNATIKETGIDWQSGGIACAG
ncbi:sensor histidine kinase [Sphingomonas sp.]|uniref:HWE histidine kinase domain-containing protein n=1 Tax=Sphingomonas sp. TaxID=28214 RepID=UPI001B219496|nr:sensor histidine kinase [Sphingomonas sp.]MBO9712443.1 sensor histidine kinase [Sphingomonas sp.]